MLLALRDREGTTAMGSMHAYAIGGAVLAELLLGGRITVDQGKRKLVNAVNAEPFGEPVIDECLAKVATAKRRAVLETWVARFASLKRLHHRVARGLCDRGVLRADEKSLLLIFKQKIYPELDPRPEHEVIGRLRKAIFEDDDRIEPRTVILASLAKGADLLRIPFDKRELKKRKNRIERLCNGELMGKATADAVQAAQIAAQAAVMVACIVPAITAST
jgi:hypothetical protein